jgi:4-hydroxy-2-oxoheptanedioate aldolase
MDLPVNPLKRAIHAGEQQIGLWTSLASTMAIEIASGSGFDWLLLDTEHAPNELPMVVDQLRAMMESPAHPIVRVPSNDQIAIKRYLV